MKAPSSEQCMRILKDNSVPENIIRHCLAVSKIAVYLAEELKRKGEKIDVNAVRAAALLHDVAKYDSILKDKGDQHHIMGRLMLEKMGYPELGEIIEKHVYEPLLEGVVKAWEEILVCYADKRVNGDKVVSLEERIEYLKERYPKHVQFFIKAEPIVLGIENRIFSRMCQSPDILNTLKADGKKELK